jgi:hypothetical protein
MFKKINLINILFISFFLIFVISIGCSSTSNSDSLAKSGAQLWGENCVRCHNAPSPDAFSDEQWEIITQHMRVRANMSVTQTEKVVEFLKMAN